MTIRRRFGTIVLAATLLFVAVPLPAANERLVWHRDTEHVDADIQTWDVHQLLEDVAVATGWQVYLDPGGASQKVSTKFKDLPVGDALRSLLGQLNFAVVPQTNGPSRLYVFRNSRAQATQLIRPIAAVKPIPNELIVTLKPGSKTKIEDLARLLGAKIIGRMDGQNAYRLQFDNQAAADYARAQLADNPDVQSVDSNYPVDPPPQVQLAAGASAPDLQLNPKPNNGNCQLVVGLIDTAMQPLSSNLAPFVEPALTVAGNCPDVSTTQPTHGTAMAETILKAIQLKTGGNTSVKILPVNVYGCGESTTTFDVANGAVTAVNNGANVLNMSLGSTSDSPFLHNIVNQINQQGIPIYAAAGNQPVTTPTYPAAYQGVVAVTASDPSGGIAPYANRGSFIDMMAPGDNVVPFDGQSYLVEGTSTATAFASGMAAGLADSAGDCADQAQSLLQKSMKPVAKTTP